MNPESNTKQRWILSPGIVKLAGQEPAYFAALMFGPTFDEYIYDNVSPDEKRRWRVYDLMRATGLKKQPVKNALRKLVKHKVARAVIEGYYCLTLEAMLHIQHVADQIVELSNDAFYQAANQYELFLEWEKTHGQTNNDESSVRTDEPDESGAVEADEVGVAPDDSSGEEGTD